jgi:hypothetical protein
MEVVAEVGAREPPGGPSPRRRDEGNDAGDGAIAARHRHQRLVAVAVVGPPGVEPLRRDEGVAALDGQLPPRVGDLAEARAVVDNLDPHAGTLARHRVGAYDHGEAKPGCGIGADAVASGAPA